MKRLLVLFAVALLGGCASYGLETETQRTARFSAFCDEIGLGKGTDDYAACMLVMAQAEPARVLRGGGMSRQNRQVLQHGKGGCTPDFSTGGCL